MHRLDLQANALITKTYDFDMLHHEGWLLNMEHISFSEIRIVPLKANLPYIR